MDPKFIGIPNTNSSTFFTKYKNAKALEIQSIVYLTVVYINIYMKSSLLKKKGINLFLVVALKLSRPSSIRERQKLILKETCSISTKMSL